jgi:hypothetical protein
MEALADDFKLYVNEENAGPKSGIMPRSISATGRLLAHATRAQVPLSDQPMSPMGGGVALKR